jgi:hypothetical protein
MRYAVPKSPANKLVLSRLGLKYSDRQLYLLFEADISQDLERIARALVELGLARSEEAYGLAASFFRNEVGP